MNMKSILGLAAVFCVFCVCRGDNEGKGNLLSNGVDAVFQRFLQNITKCSNGECQNGEPCHNVTDVCNLDALSKSKTACQNVLSAGICGRLCDLTKGGLCGNDKFSECASFSDIKGVVGKCQPKGGIPKVELRILLEFTLTNKTTNGTVNATALALRTGNALKELKSLAGMINLFQTPWRMIEIGMRNITITPPGVLSTPSSPFYITAISIPLSSTALDIAKTNWGKNSTDAGEGTRLTNIVTAFTSVTDVAFNCTGFSFFVDRVPGKIADLKKALNNVVLKGEAKSCKHDWECSSQLFGNKAFCATGLNSDATCAAFTCPAPLGVVSTDGDDSCQPINATLFTSCGETCSDLCSKYSGVYIGGRCILPGPYATQLKAESGLIKPEKQTPKPVQPVKVTSCDSDAKNKCSKKKEAELYTCLKANATSPGCSQLVAAATNSANNKCAAAVATNGVCAGKVKHALRDCLFDNAQNLTSDCQKVIQDERSKSCKDSIESIGCNQTGFTLLDRIMCLKNATDNNADLRGFLTTACAEKLSNIENGVCAKDRLYLCQSEVELLGLATCLYNEAQASSSSITAACKNRINALATAGRLYDPNSNTTNGTEFFKFRSLDTATPLSASEFVEISQNSFAESSSGSVFVSTETVPPPPTNTPIGSANTHVPMNIVLLLATLAIATFSL